MFLMNVGYWGKKEETETRCFSKNIPAQSAFKAMFKQTFKNSSLAVIQEMPSCHCQEVKYK